MAFADAMFIYHREETEFEDALCKVGFADFTRIGGDSYDDSVEFYGVGDDIRLTPEQQKIVYDAGFCKCYVNHNDKSETHYHWTLEEIKAMAAGADFIPKRGWRRKRKDGGGFIINYWPDSWNGPSSANWVKDGYIVVEPDPLDAEAKVA